MPAQCSFFNGLGVSPARKLLRTRRPTRDTLILTIFGLDMFISLHHTTNIFWSNPTHRAKLGEAKPQFVTAFSIKPRMACPMLVIMKLAIPAMMDVTIALPVENSAASRTPIRLPIIINNAATK
jgi:hypothetical protein